MHAHDDEDGLGLELLHILRIMKGLMNWLYYLHRHLFICLAVCKITKGSEWILNTFL